MKNGDEIASRYLIPDNFIEEGTVFQGRIRIRNLIEAVILAGIFCLPGLALIRLLGVASLQAKVSVLAAMCLPPACAGIAGFNGDRIFLALRCMLEWFKNRGIMLYNPRPVLLRNDPVKTMDSDVSAAGRLISDFEKRRKERMDKRAGEKLSEGEDFFFTPEETMERYLKSGNTGKETAGEETPLKFEGSEILEDEVELY